MLVKSWTIFHHLDTFWIVTFVLCSDVVTVATFSTSKCDIDAHLNHPFLFLKSSNVYDLELYHGLMMSAI